MVEHLGNGLELKAESQTVIKTKDQKTKLKSEKHLGNALELVWLNNIRNNFSLSFMHFSHDKIHEHDQIHEHDKF